MRRITLLGLVAVVSAAGPACRGPQATPPPAPATAAAAPARPDERAAAHRASPAIEEALRLAVAAESQAVDLETRRLATTRQLFAAGRVGATELQTAELELLRLQQRLRLRERELQEALERAPSARAHSR